MKVTLILYTTNSNQFVRSFVPDTYFQRGIINKQQQYANE
jgi:hypothetical protein